MNAKKQPTAKAKQILKIRFLDESYLLSRNDDGELVVNGNIKLDNYGRGFQKRAKAEAEKAKL